MRTRRSKPINYKVTRTNSKRVSSPATANPKASLSGGAGASSPKKRGRPMKKDKEAVVVDQEPRPPQPKSPGDSKRGRGRPPSVRSRLAGTPSPKKKTASVPVESPEASSARDKRARARHIANRNAGAPPKSVVKGKAKNTVSSTKKGVRIAAGVKKSVANGKGKGKKRDTRASAAKLMQAFFRANRDTFKDLTFHTQQKRLGAMWKVSPLNPKNETAAESNDEDDNPSTSSERPSAPSSPSIRAEESVHPDDVLFDEMDDAEKLAAGTSSGTTEWETTDSSSETAADSPPKQSSSKPKILRHRPSLEQPYPEEDPDGAYYLTESENEEGTKVKGKKKKKGKDGRFTHHILEEVAISVNRVLEEGENGGSSDSAGGPSDTATTDNAGAKEEEGKISVNGN